jgi:hypothetical protein
MPVLCSIPIQIPVHRIRVRARCLAIGGPVHTAALRLADIYGESPEEIAEVLGLKIPHVEGLLADLQAGGEPIEREFVVWVDHARGRILPHSALTGVAVKPTRGGAFTLREDLPSPNRLANLGLAAGLSWDLGLEGYVEVLDVLDVIADLRNASLPHELRLPDTQLVIRSHEQGVEEWIVGVTQHGTLDPLLTRWTRTNYAEDIKQLIEDSALLTEDAPPPGPPDPKNLDRWQPREPHPARLREQVTALADQAQQRVVLSAPDLTDLPAWLGETLSLLNAREIPLVLCPGQPELVPSPRTLDFETATIPHPLPGLTLIADDTRAVLHSDADACLERSSAPVRQSLSTSSHQQTIARLLDRLGLKTLRPRPAAPRITLELIASMLQRDLEQLRPELPTHVPAKIQPDDERFAIDTIDRKNGRDGPTHAARKTTAGIAWERILISQLEDLAADHEHVRILAVRWKAPKIALDLDVIVHDRLKDTVWIFDAKNAQRNPDQIDKAKKQIHLLNKAPHLTPTGTTIKAAIVHRSNQLTSSPQPTEHPDILRATLQGLPDLLLARHLPGEQPAKLRDEAA